jgi:hypothetical protein
MADPAAVSMRGGWSMPSRGPAEEIKPISHRCRQRPTAA